MQWDKVKNILLVILLLVDGFLAVGLAGRYVRNVLQQRALLRDIQIVLAQYDVSCGEQLSIPPQRSMIALEADRSRPDEETFAQSVLTGTLRHEEKEDGETLFSGDNGTVRWRTNGSVYAEFNPSDAEMPGSVRAMKKEAAALLSQCGVSLTGNNMDADLQSGTASVTGSVAGVPVFNRVLTISWQGRDKIVIQGQWFFGTPYATTSDRERLCSAEDALLQVARGESEQGKINRIDSIVLGYRMDVGVGARLQLSPFWRVGTDKGLVFVDALK